MIYYDDTHTYLSDWGIIIPSVTNIVAHATGKTFTNIPPAILDNARNFGTTIHSAIEKYLTSWQQPEFEDEKLKNSWSNFMKLYEEHIGKDHKLEQMINYEDRYAGRYDCLSDGCIIDFKTSHKLDIESLSWQLSYYDLALGGGHKLYGLWLPKKGKGKWQEIERIPDEKLLENLKSYEQENKSSIDNLEY